MTQRNDVNQNTEAPVPTWSALAVVWFVAIIVSVLPVVVWAFVPNPQVPIAHDLSAAVALVLVLCFSYFLKVDGLVTAQAPRVSSLILGILSVACSLWLGRDYEGNPAVGMQHAVTMWLKITVGALVALLVVTFAFEMARRERSRLIDSLAIVVASGAIAWCAGGWVFLADSLVMGPGRFVLAIVVVIVLAAVVGFAIPWGVRRRNTLDSDENDESDDGTSAPAVKHSPQAALGTGVSVYSMGVMPVILTGACVPLLLLLFAFVG